MSTYRRPRSMDPSRRYDAAALAAAAAAANSPSSDPPAAPKDWTMRRKAQPAEYLLPAGRRWLDLLPPESFPSALAAHYPRIVNLIALQWDDRSACVRYFRELLFDRRGGRQGFPGPVQRDLRKVCAYWYRAGPGMGAWGPPVGH
jgi:hypothetical protein